MFSIKLFNNNFFLNFILISLIIIYCVLIVGFTKKQNINPDDSLFFEDFYAQYISAKNYTELYRPYPPTTSLLYLPFLKFPYRTAAVFFLALNIFLFIFILYQTSVLLEFNNIKKKNIFYTAAFCFLPFYDTLYLGNLNIFIIALIILSIKIDVSKKKGIKSIYVILIREKKYEANVIFLKKKENIFF